MRYFQTLAVLIPVFLASIGFGEELTDADKAIAEAAKREAVAVAKGSVMQKEQALKQARLQRSPQVQVATKELDQAKKDLVAANRKSLAEYLAESKQPKAARELMTPDGLPRGITDSKGLSVIFPYTVAHVAQGKDISEYSIMLCSFNGKKPIEGFFDIDGKPVRLEATSSDENIVSINPDPKFLFSPFIVRFSRPGKAIVTVTAGEYTVDQEIEVVQLPINADASSGDVIQSLGFPTEKKSVYVEWPKDEFVDCFFYSPEAGDPFIGEHWTYEKYPSLVLSIEDGKLQKVGTRKSGNDSRRSVVAPTPNKKEAPRSAIQ